MILRYQRFNDWLAKLLIFNNWWRTKLWLEDTQDNPEVWGEALISQGLHIPGTALLNQSEQVAIRYSGFWPLLIIMIVLDSSPNQPRSWDHPAARVCDQGRGRKRCWGDQIRGMRVCGRNSAVFYQHCQFCASDKHSAFGIRQETQILGLPLFQGNLWPFAYSRSSSWFRVLLWGLNKSRVKCFANGWSRCARSSLPLKPCIQSAYLLSAWYASSSVNMRTNENGVY